MFTPAFFAGRKVLVVGGGRVAERRAKNLLAAGAKIRLVAPELTPALRQLASEGNLEWVAREWQAGDVAATPEALLVFAATGSPDINGEVAREARTQGRLVNRADAPGESDFTLPGVVNTGEFTLAVATVKAGEEGLEATPALTGHLKRELQQHFGPAYNTLARLLRELRPLVKTRVEYNRRAALWQEILNSPALELVKDGQEIEARELLEGLIEQYSERTVA